MRVNGRRLDRLWTVRSQGLEVWDFRFSWKQTPSHSMRDYEGLNGPSPTSPAKYPTPPFPLPRKLRD